MLETLTPFPINILGSLIHRADIVKNQGVWFDADFSFLEHVRTCKARYMTFVEFDSILLKKCLSLLQMPWLVVIWTIVTLSLEGCHVSSCRVFRMLLNVLSQIIESMLMLHTS